MIGQDVCNELHEQLLNDRQRLEHEISRLSGAGIRSDTFQEDETDAVDQHPADEGSELFEREKNLTLQRTLETTLQQVDDALHRFDEGTYGLCEECGRPIAEKRLRALPYATHCIDCQAKIESTPRATT
ncbi:MAG TPA: TraR/DksA C4-type zinc finger protein [Chloroflexota bacterium]|nr:TraR/DksA C4-type zinc finger protein [Chloroflexota bacterium]